MAIYEKLVLQIPSMGSLKALASIMLIRLGWERAEILSSELKEGLIWSLR